jgi:small subunit ribosomal protein S5e
MAEVEEPIVDAPEEEEEVEEVAVVEEQEEFVVGPGGAAEIKLFGKWSFDDIEVRDISLVVSTYIAS